VKKALQLLCTVCLLLLQWGAAAQNPEHGGIPDEVYYLMPRFGNGMVYFRGQMPAAGELNICALDNTLRFMGPDGKELEANNIENVLRVQIDTVFFLRYKDAFYRQYPVSGDIGIALRRSVRIMRDAKPAAYGGTSMTSSVTEFSSIYADGMTHQLEGRKDYPFDVQERVSVYKGDTVYPLTKKNLKKLYPEKKDEIEAWFKEGNSLPDTVEELIPLLAGWAR
jgi:hypothetical protein